MPKLLFEGPNGHEVLRCPRIACSGRRKVRQSACSETRELTCLLQSESCANLKPDYPSQTMFHSARRRQTLKPGVPIVFSVTNREERCTLAARKLRYQSEVRRIEIREEDALDDADERVGRGGEVVERAISE